MTAPGDRSSRVGRDNFGIIITGNENVVQVGPDQALHLSLDPPSEDWQRAEAEMKRVL